MDDKYINSLLDKLQEGSISLAEKKDLLNWYRELAAQEGQYPDDENAVRLRMLLRLENELFPQPKRISLWQKIAVAASVLLVLSGGGYFLLRQQPATKNVIAQNDIGPGGNKAIITLANGKKINVTDAKTGQLAIQGNVRIVKAADGQLHYDATGGTPADLTKIYNTVNTPVGGKHSVTLSDGTIVILDANSSVTFPVVFDKGQRLVSVTGQAWFHVNYKSDQPFFTTAKGETIKDLGTEFNVNAYDDEPDLRTTLLEGGVEVNGTKIHPGEQTVLKDGNLRVRSADTAAIMAWKNGNFVLRNQDLRTTMRQLARWYNVQVRYADNAPMNLQIGGTVSRSRNLSVVLAAIARTGAVKFEINGQIVTVSR